MAGGAFLQALRGYGKAGRILGTRIEVGLTVANCGSCYRKIRDAWIYYSKETGKLEVCNSCYIRLKKEETGNV